MLFKHQRSNHLHPTHPKTNKQTNKYTNKTLECFIDERRFLNAFNVMIENSFRGHSKQSLAKH